MKRDKNRKCPLCGVIRGEAEFFEVINKGVSHYNHYCDAGPLTDEHWRNLHDKRDDIRYDYNYARLVLGMDIKSAVIWVSRGYKTHPFCLHRGHIARQPRRSWKYDKEIED